MRVALVHNIAAGAESHETPDLERLLRDAGHEVESFGSGKSDVKRALQGAPDVLAVAGGDGTVAKTAKVIHKRGGATPMYVLPAGTSNNIGRTLGVDRPIPELVRALGHARRSRLDIGEVEAPWGARRFVEGVGSGFIGTMLENDGSLGERLGRAARAVLHPRTGRSEAIINGLTRLIRGEPTREHRITADGEELSGDYIAVALMNIREIGPRVALAPGAVSSDGLLDLILVRGEDREALVDWVRSADAPARVPGISRRIRQAEIEWPPAGGHVDDCPWPRATERTGGEQVVVSVRGAIELLLPAP